MALLPTWTRYTKHGEWIYETKEHYKTETSDPEERTDLGWETSNFKTAWQWTIAYDIDQWVRTNGIVWQEITMGVSVLDIGIMGIYELQFKLEVYRQITIFTNNWDYRWKYRIGYGEWIDMGVEEMHDDMGFVVMSVCRDWDDDTIDLKAELYERDGDDYGDLVYNCSKAFDYTWNDFVEWGLYVKQTNFGNDAWIEGNNGTRSAGSLVSEEVNWNPLGDCNGDGIVDMLDVGIVNAAWHEYRSIGDNDWDERADVNSDGYIDIGDATVIQLHWHETG